MTIRHLPLNVYIKVMDILQGHCDTTALKSFMRTSRLPNLFFKLTWNGRNVDMATLTLILNINKLELNTENVCFSYLVVPRKISFSSSVSWDPVWGAIAP